jgi:hypothetical protein
MFSLSHHHKATWTMLPDSTHIIHSLTNVGVDFSDALHDISQYATFFGIGSIFTVLQRQNTGFAAGRSPEPAVQIRTHLCKIVDVESSA